MLERSSACIPLHQAHTKHISSTSLDDYTAKGTRPQGLCQFKCELEVYLNNDGYGNKHCNEIFASFLTSATGTEE